MLINKKIIQIAVVSHLEWRIPGNFILASDGGQHPETIALELSYNILWSFDIVWKNTKKGWFEIKITHQVDSGIGGCKSDETWHIFLKKTGANRFNLMLRLDKLSYKNELGLI